MKPENPYICPLFISSTARDDYIPFHHVGICLQTGPTRLFPPLSEVSWDEKHQMAPFIRVLTVYPCGLPLHWCGEDERGGRRLLSSWLDRIRPSVWSGCGSLAFILDGCMLCFCRGRRQGQSQPQTEEDDEMTHVEGSWAAVSGWIRVPRELNETQDQDPGNKHKTIQH